MGNMYNKGLAYLQGAGDWSAGGTTFKLMLVTSTYTFNTDHNFKDEITNEVTNTGYTAGGYALATRAITENDTDDRAEATSDDPTVTSMAAGDQPYAAVIYRDTGTPATSELIAYCTLTTPPAPDGNNYTINQPSAGWFYFTN